MTFNDIPVAPISQRQIEEAAAAWIRESSQEGQEVIDILKIYRVAKVDIVVRRDSEMGDDLARAAPSSNRVFIRGSLLEAVTKCDSTAHMVLAHEFGHVVFHRGPEMKARKVNGNAELGFIPQQESAEHQAWKSARALKMPLAVVRASSSADELARRCDVPIEHAQSRLIEVDQLAGRREIPAFAQSIVEKRRSSRELADERKAKEAGELLRAWNNAQRIPGERGNARLCSLGKWRVVWSEYNQTTQCGWRLRNGKIIAWMGDASD
jgi:hypothetical protein